MIKIVLFLFLATCLLPPSAYAAGLIRDAEIEDTLREYSNPIFTAAGLKPSAINIYIVQDDSLNAFVAGGANLFLHTGIILATKTPDMLLGVIAHETGHIAGGHLATQAPCLWCRNHRSPGLSHSRTIGASTAGTVMNSCR